VTESGFFPIDDLVASAPRGPAQLPAGVRVFEKAYAHEAPRLSETVRLGPGETPIRLHELDLYVTMRCNIRCHFCNVRAGEYRHKDIPLDRVRSLLDEAIALGLEEVHFLGGEPTIRPDLEPMIAHAASAGLHTRIITNGMMLGRDRMRRLVESGLRQIMISVDGLEETHNRLRQSGPDGWATTMQCVRDAVGLGLRTRVSTVAYVDNADEIPGLMDLVEGMGVHIFSVFLGSPLGRGHTMLDRVVDPHSWRRLQETVAAKAAATRPDFEVVMEQGFAWKDGPAVDRSQLKGRGTGCNTLLEDFDYLIVRSDGNLYQCVFFMTEGPPIGNILDQPLEPTLLHARRVAAYRDFTVANDRCRSCHHQSDCGTGCRGYAYLYKGDWLKTDPRCSKGDPAVEEAPPYYPLCPIMKVNVRNRQLGGSTEQALERSILA
jgi:radical SAM protein with 4Fe4S-binding SPASM domain